MEENKKIIKLSDNRVLRLDIYTSKGEATGEFLEFDLEDVEYPLKVNQAHKEHVKNFEILKADLRVLEKKEDKKGKYILSWKDEETIRIYREFFQREMKAIDLIIGEGGCKKLLNGRKPYVTMFNEISDILKEQVEPYLKENSKNINDYIEDIKKKYKNTDGDVLEV